jgi:hypothetical protein
MTSYLKGKAAAPVWKTDINGRWISSALILLFSQKLALKVADQRQSQSRYCSLAN